MKDYNIVERPVPAKEENFVEEMPISAMIDVATKLSDDALRQTCALKSHLFGMVHPDELKEDKPMCFKDVLELHVRTMERVCINLDEIKKGIGI